MTIEEMNIERRRVEAEIKKVLTESTLSIEPGILVTACDLFYIGTNIHVTLHVKVK